MAYIKCASLVMTLLMASLSCSPASLVSIDNPSTVVDPGVVTTPSGALQLYRQAVGVFAESFGGSLPSGAIFGGHVGLSGLFTDEMVNGEYAGLEIDSRTMADFRVINGIYQRPRVIARQAREALQRYYRDAPTALRGRLHALEGYFLLFAAETYCSGFPITEVPLVGSPTFSVASTQELLERAIAQFDSAILLSSDTVRFVRLGQVGKARALLNLGKFEEARAVARLVPQDFVYEVEYGVTGTMQSPQENGIGRHAASFQIQDQKGGNGLIWSSDPRTAPAVVTVTLYDGDMDMQVTAKYSRTREGGLDPTVAAPAARIRLADGLEARLIEAESDLALGQPGWLPMLRQLRETCIGSSPCAPVPGLVEESLPSSALTDPGTATQRLDLLMRERAMWLFATGHRQGDLRRLVRIYHRVPETLWPVGEYVNQYKQRLYGTVGDVTLYNDRYVFEYGLDGSSALYKGCSSLDPGAR